MCFFGPFIGFSKKRSRLVSSPLPGQPGRPCEEDSLRSEGHCAYPEGACPLLGYETSPESGDNLTREEWNAAFGFLGIKRQKRESDGVYISPHTAMRVQGDVTLLSFHEELATRKDRKRDQDIRHVLVIVRVRVKSHGTVSGKEHR